MSDYTVYIHTNKINGLKYVGITHQKPETRWLSGYGYYKQSHFWRAIQKYGWDNFEHEIVASGLTLEKAASLERELIAKYNTCDNRFGYNKSTGGESGSAGVPRTKKQREAARNNIRKAHNDPKYREALVKRLKNGSMQTEEIKRKRIESRGVVHLSAEAKAKISAAKKGHKLGPFTEEHKQRIRDNHAGGAELKPVICIETNRKYKCINDASRDTGINKKGISGCCRGLEHYNTAGGYHWKFAQ